MIAVEQASEQCDKRRVTRPTSGTVAVGGDDLAQLHRPTLGEILEY